MGHLICPQKNSHLRDDFSAGGPVSGDRIHRVRSDEVAAEGSVARRRPRRGGGCGGDDPPRVFSTFYVSQRAGSRLISIHRKCTARLSPLTGRRYGTG